MNYEVEIKALLAWFRQKSDEYTEIKKRESANIENSALDSPLVIIYKQDTFQLDRRAWELLEKYGLATKNALEKLENYRLNVNYHEEMYALTEWLKQKVLECLDVVEKEVKMTGVKRQDWPLDPIYLEFHRRLDALKEKHGMK